MAIVHTPYEQSLKILTGAGNWLTDTVKLALLEDGYIFNAAHTMFDSGTNNSADPSFYELAQVSGYTTGGIALTNKTIANNNINAGTVIFPFTAEKIFRYGILYIDSTVDTIAKPLLFNILFDDFPADITVPSVSFVVSWNASGIATLTTATV